MSANKSKKDMIYIESDAEKSDEETESSKKGRRNIRKVLEDGNLDEATKKANKEEEEHRERLLRKHKSV